MKSSNDRAPIETNLGILQFNGCASRQSAQVRHSVPRGHRGIRETLLARERVTLVTENKIASPTSGDRVSGVNAPRRPALDNRRRATRWWWATDGGFFFFFARAFVTSAFSFAAYVRARARAHSRPRARINSVGPTEKEKSLSRHFLGFSILDYVTIRRSDREISYGASSTMGKFIK